MGKVGRKQACVVHPQAKEIHDWMLNGVTVTEIHRRIDPPIGYDTLLDHKKRLLAHEIASPAAAKIAKPVTQYDLRRHHGKRPPHKAPQAPAPKPPPVLPAEVEPSALIRVRRQVESAERFYEDRMLSVHEEQLKYLRDLTSRAEKAEPEERIGILSQATKVITSGALERSLGEAASYANVRRGQSSGGGQPLVSMNWVVMERADTQPNHVLERKTPPALIDVKPADQ